MMQRIPEFLLIVVVGILTSLPVLAGNHGVTKMSLVITSPAFSQNESIPDKYTCDGEDISPPLKWSGVPAGSRCLALIVDDPDAPDPAAPRMTWVHWVLAWRYLAGD
jgi:phosphatidylethanolamine-binding protein (PEBP) family uncharacterized protein